MELTIDEGTRESRIRDRIYLSLWRNPGYLPDPVADAFRCSVVQVAMDICHETGDEDSYVAFCAKTIADWMAIDTAHVNLGPLRKEALK